MTRHYHPLPFSPGGQFAWNRPTVHDGQPKKVGDPVDKSAFTELRLRQLYEQRKIIPASFEGPTPAFLANGAALARKIKAEAPAEPTAPKREAKPAPKAAAPKHAPAKKARTKKAA